MIATSLSDHVHSYALLLLIPTNHHHTYVYLYAFIKTHDSESQVQEEASHTQYRSEQFTCSTTLKSVNKLP